MRRGLIRLMGLERRLFAILLVQSILFNQSFFKVITRCEFYDIKGKSYEPICLDMLKHLRLNFFDDKPDVDYRDIWRLKAKLVLGKEYPDRI